MPRTMNPQSTEEGGVNSQENDRNATVDNRVDDQRSPAQGSEKPKGQPMGNPLQEGTEDPNK